MKYRNSRAYRLVSKIVSPIIMPMYPVPATAPAFEHSSVALDKESVSSDWKWYQPELVSTRFSDIGLIMTCQCESVWYGNLRGPMLYRNIAGDCAISARVRTRKSSDISSYPDTQYQFGGVIFRDPTSDAWMSRESYVFNVVGYRHSALQVETKSTRYGYSKVSACDWESGDAELLIERRGSVFSLKARALETTEWQEVCQYTRPDFPAVLQMGLIVYAYSEGRAIFDLQAEFGAVSVTQP